MLRIYQILIKIPFLLLSILLIFSCASVETKSTKEEDQNTDINTSAGIFFNTLISQEKPVRLLIVISPDKINVYSNDENLPFDYRSNRAMYIESVQKQIYQTDN